MAKKTIEDIDVKGKKVLVRVDYNVPLDDKQQITNDKRVKATFPTINYLLNHGAAVILASHLGRPKGKVVPEMSLRPVAVRLSEEFDKDVIFVNDCIGEEVEKAAAALKPGDIMLLENLRFHPEEEKNDPGFAKKLASLADVAVDDAFGCAHRGHASNCGVADYIEMVSGLLMRNEIDFIGKALEEAQHPFVAVIGGAKVSDKIGVIGNLLDKVDTIIIGGGMAHTFNAAKGLSIGDSICEPEKYELARELLKKAKEKNVRFVLPIDAVVADKFEDNANVKIVDCTDIEPGWQGLDVGPKTEALFVDAMKCAKTVIWNGPMGVFEFENFKVGTVRMAQIVAQATMEGAVSIVGGGDSVAALKKTGLSGKISHVSTGGGATLEYLEGKPMPGIQALADK